MKLTRSKLKNLILETLSEENVYISDLESFEFPENELSLYETQENHARLLVALKELPELLRNALIPLNSASREIIDEEESFRYVELAEILKGLQK